MIEKLLTLAASVVILYTVGLLMTYLVICGWHKITKED
jgi:hypothetical protein